MTKERQRDFELRKENLTHVASQHSPRLSEKALISKATCAEKSTVSYQSIAEKSTVSYQSIAQSPGWIKAQRHSGD